jgi:hypothetical protein
VPERHDQLQINPEERTMTKDRRRGNRELKKPKQAKPKAAVAAATSSLAQTVTDVFTRGKKRW